MSDYPEYVPISIHAPAKGATVSYLESDTYHNISIHAPAKGATFLWICKRYICWYFNPRSREGSDRLAYAVTHTPNYFNPRSREGSDEEYLLHSYPHTTISIHAPAKGATRWSCLAWWYRNFNPRSREGSDDIDLMLLASH